MLARPRSWIGLTFFLARPPTVKFELRFLANDDGKT